MERSVLIVGGGELGRHLAGTLQASGRRITMVEVSPVRAEALRRSLGDVVTVGSGTDGEMLERAGVRGCDVLVAATGSDEANLVVASLARFRFGVRRVIARVIRPSHAWLFREDMGVDVALDESELLARLVVDDLSSNHLPTP